MSCPPEGLCCRTWPQSSDRRPCRSSWTCPGWAVGGCAWSRRSPPSWWPPPCSRLEGHTAASPLSRRWAVRTRGCGGGCELCCAGLWTPSWHVWTAQSSSSDWVRQRAGPPSLSLSDGQRPHFEGDTARPPPSAGYNMGSSLLILLTGRGSTYILAVVLQGTSPSYMSEHFSWRWRLSCFPQ